jgi:NADH-quinone oxidoreductase subunit D
MAVALKTQEIVLNMGPQHPSTHGVFRMVLTLEGETIVDLKPVYGYLHRGIEKLSEGRSYLQAVPITDRLDYMCALDQRVRLRRSRREVGRY